MKYFFSSLGLAAVAAAHGFVQNATIGGKEYDFYQPYQDPYTNPKPDRVSRIIAGNGPVEDFSLADIQCGGAKAYGQDGSAPAALHADATAGSEVELRWTLWPDSHVGPVITYMAECPSTGCNDWMPGTEAVWFKIKEEGREGTTNNWAATPLMKAGGIATYTIPECIKPGYYLVRHEIIALHAAFAYPGAQAYPGCHQLKVSGSGSTSPSTGLVSFPGAYKEDTPGIVFDAYKAQEYPLPGPSVFSCSGGSGSAPKPSSAAPVATSAPVSSAPAVTPSPSAAPTSVVVENASSTPAAPVSTPTPSAGSGSSTEYNLESFITYLESRTDTPEEFTLRSFVDWLQQKPSSGSPAPTSVGIKSSSAPSAPAPTKGSTGNGSSGGKPVKPVKSVTSTLVTVVKPVATATAGSGNGNGSGNTPTTPSSSAVAAPAPSSGTTTPEEKEYTLESFVAWLEEQEE